MDSDPKTLAFLDVPRRGTTIDIHAENFTYTTSTEILDCDPDGQGGLVLTLRATIEEGQLVLTEAMIAAAEHNGDGWEVRHGDLVFVFGQAESELRSDPRVSSRTIRKRWTNTTKRCASVRRARRPSATSNKVAKHPSPGRTPHVAIPRPVVPPSRRCTQSAWLGPSAVLESPVRLGRSEHGYASNRERIGSSDRRRDRGRVRHRDWAVDRAGG